MRSAVSLMQIAVCEISLGRLLVKRGVYCFFCSSGPSKNRTNVLFFSVHLKGILL